MTTVSPFSATQRRAALRPGIDALEDSRISEVAMLGMGQPDVIPLWFGEGDQPTPPFICEAAARARSCGARACAFRTISAWGRSTMLIRSPR